MKSSLPLVCVSRIRCSLHNYKRFGDIPGSLQLEGDYVYIIIGLLLHYLLMHWVKKYIPVYSEVPSCELATAVYESVLVMLQFCASGSPVLTNQKVY